MKFFQAYIGSCILFFFSGWEGVGVGGQMSSFLLKSFFFSSFEISKVGDIKTYE